MSLLFVPVSSSLDATYANYQTLSWVFDLLAKTCCEFTSVLSFWGLNIRGENANGIPAVIAPAAKIKTGIFVAVCLKDASQPKADSQQNEKDR